MNEPLVSVVMAVCNADRFLAESIQSILDQSFRDFEFIIADYGSTDDSKPIISSFMAKDDRIMLREVPPCVLPAARNAGCFHTQGRYIAIMDADDVSLPDRMFREVDYMEKHPQVALLGGAVEWIDSSGRPFHIHRHPTGYREIKKELTTHSVFWHPTVIMRRDAFDLVGGYRSALVCSHDYDLALRIAEKFECANLDEVVLKYRIHPLQLSADRQRTQTLCKLAVQASATARMKGEQDLLDTALEVTPATLAAMGVGEFAQSAAAIDDGYVWIRNMINAGEHLAAAIAARRILESNADEVGPRRASELHLIVAAAHWKERRIWKSITAAARAVLARPILVGRPIKPLLHRLGLA